MSHLSWQGGERLKEASERAQTCRAALGDVSLDSVSSDLTALGSDPLAALRARRQELTGALNKARVAAAKAVTDFTLAEERSRTAQAALGMAIAARDAELAKFPEGMTYELSAAQTAAAATSNEQKTIAAEMASLESTIAEQMARVEAAVANARAAVGRARGECELAEAARTAVLKLHAAEGGRLETLRKQRNSLDLEGAETRLQEASERFGALPVPEKSVTEADVTVARNAEASAKADLERIVSEIHKTQGALEQVGGAVARERLRDAIEAYDLAERQERDIEAEYDAWLLLLQQMKEADAAQASNLGLVLAPAIAGKFEALTKKRYDNNPAHAPTRDGGLPMRQVAIWSPGGRAGSLRYVTIRREMASDGLRSRARGNGCPLPDRSGPLDHQQFGYGVGCTRF